MVVRLAALASLAVLAGAGVFVVHDRNRLEAQIAARQRDHPACLALHARASAPQLAATCGWSSLAEARTGDLLAIPFLALALALALFLLVRVRHTAAADLETVGFVGPTTPEPE